MGEPLARMETTGEGVLADAARRLERALETLEAALGERRRTAPFTPAGATAVVVELEAARGRSRELETAATAASQALGLAMQEVRRALEEDDVGPQDAQASLFDPGLFDRDIPDGDLPDGDRVDSALESKPGSADDHQAEAAGSAVEKEPMA